MKTKGPVPCQVFAIHLQKQVTTYLQKLTGSQDRRPRSETHGLTSRVLAVLRARSDLFLRGRPKAAPPAHRTALAPFPLTSAATPLRQERGGPTDSPSRDLPPRPRPLPRGRRRPTVSEEHRGRTAACSGTTLARATPLPLGRAALLSRAPLANFAPGTTSPRTGGAHQSRPGEKWRATILATPTRGTRARGAVRADTSWDLQERALATATEEARRRNLPLISGHDVLGSSSAPRLLGPFGLLRLCQGIQLRALVVLNLQASGSFSMGPDHRVSVPGLGDDGVLRNSVGGPRPQITPILGL